MPGQRTRGTHPAGILTSTAFPHPETSLTVRSALNEGSHSVAGWQPPFVRPSCALRSLGSPREALSCPPGTVPEKEPNSTSGELASLGQCFAGVRRAVHAVRRLARRALLLPVAPATHARLCCSPPAAIAQMNELHCGCAARRRADHVACFLLWQGSTRGCEVGHRGIRARPAARGPVRHLCPAAQNINLIPTSLPYLSPAQRRGQALVELLCSSGVCTRFL